MVGSIQNRLNNLSWSSLVIYVLGLASLLSGYQAFSHLHLFSDGSHVLMNMLTTQGIFNPNENRFLSNLLQQFLPFILIKTGITNIELISLAFGVNLFFIPIISIVICFALLENPHKGLVAIPVLWLLFVMHNNSTFIISEAFIATAFFWPLITYALFKGPRLKSFWVFLIGVFCLAFTHELAYVLISLLIVGLIANSIMSSGELVAKAFSILFAVICFALSWSKIPPGYLSDAAGQMSGLASLKQYPLTTVTIIVILTLSLASMKRMVTIGFLTVFTIITVLILLPVLNPGGILYPILHWEQRILIMLSAVIFSVLFIMTRVAKAELDKGPLPKLALIILVLSVTLYQVRMTSLWNSYQKRFNLILEDQVGLVDYHHSVLAKEPKMNQFITPWTANTTGLLFQSFEHKEIKALIWLREDIWQAWHSSDRNHWPDLKAYGVEYQLFGPRISY